MPTQDRRGFLKAAATLGTTLIASPVLSASPSGDGDARKADARLGQRTLGTGKHRLRVSSLGLGCMGMSYHRSFIPERKVSISLIRKAVDMGVTFFDTAEAYGPHTNEGLVGEALQPVRKDVVLCSKFGFNIQNGQLAGLNSKPPHIRAVVDQSMTRQPENDVIKVCEELGIGFVPYSPLSRAFLSGFLNQNTKYNASNDNRPSLPRYQPDAAKANWAMIDTLAEFGNPRGLTPAQVALAWLLAQKPWIVPIPGTTKLAHLQEHLWSADFEVTADELRGFTEAVSKITIVGEHDTGTQAQQTNR